MIYEAVTNNPSIDILGNFVFSIDELVYYIGLGEKPYKIEIKKGLEDTYVSALKMFEDDKVSGKSGLPKLPELPELPDLPGL